ncbi:hypothetical protein Aduo_000610 [Ancylostoma duodenale]
MLPLYLTGPAKIKNNNIAEVDKLPWKELVTTLAKRFRGGALRSNLRDELHNITLGKDSVAEFAEKIFNKTKFAFQGQDRDMTTQMTIDFFIKGVIPEIRNAIRRLSEMNDFDAVVASAYRQKRNIR